MVIGGTSDLGGLYGRRLDRRRLRDRCRCMGRLDAQENRWFVDRPVRPDCSSSYSRFIRHGTNGSLGRLVPLVWILAPSGLAAVIRAAS
jgi:hypothetical protein